MAQSMKVINLENNKLSNILVSIYTGVEFSFFWLLLKNINYVKSK